ncbi:MAG TPA: NAD(P)H-dependent oxidoreductase [Chitinophagaceae bacterium]|jgi:chromate reductase|nr:NAD(P)H-dependent oxidoreductase [Chitinophagaceae bacterium]
MSDYIQLVGLSGSLRKGSYNTLLLKAAAQLLPADVSMEIVSIADIPLYNADLDLPAAKQRPEVVEHFRKMLADADGILISSPEYNYSIPGGLKNAIDWASRGEDSPLLRKPIAVIGATTGLWGTTRMQMAFHNVFLFLDMRPVYKPEVLVAQAEKKFNKDGNLIDEIAKKLVKQKLEALKELIHLQSQVGDILDTKVI